MSGSEWVSVGCRSYSGCTSRGDMGARPDGAVAMKARATKESGNGNLSVHERRLEDAGYVLCEKTFSGRTPRTEYRLRTGGRWAFEKYLDHMDALIKAARKK